MIPSIKITYTPNIKFSDLPEIATTDDAYSLAFESWDKGKIQFIEQFKIMLLNRDCKVLGIYEVSSGGFSNTYVDLKLIFIAALQSCASAIILFHNHPSGSLKVSNEDKMLTQKIIDAGKLLDIKILDHIILANEKYLSFEAENIL